MPVAAVLAKALRKHAFLENIVGGGAIGGTVGAVRDLDEGETRGEAVMRSAGTGAATGLGVTLGALAGAALGAGVGGATGATVGHLTGPSDGKHDIGGATGGIAGMGLGALAGGAIGGVGGGVLAYQLAKRRPKEKTASAILVTLLEKNASVKVAGDAGQPLPTGSQQAARHIETVNAQLGGKDGVPGDWSKLHPGAVMPSEVQQFFQKRDDPKPAEAPGLLGQYWDEAKSMAGSAGGAIADAAQAGADKLHGLFSNAQTGPATKAEIDARKSDPGMLSNYWNKLKSGDTATVAGTGAAALLAAVLTHNLLKKRSKR